MKDYVILTDSCSDMGKTLRDKYEIEYIPLHYTARGKEYVADLDWKEIPAHDFYNIIRQGDRITTSAINETDFINYFSDYLSKGKDILYLGCSSALSSSVKASFVAQEKVKTQFPDGKLICIDTLRAGRVLALLITEAAKLKQQGKSIEEVADFVEKEKLNFHQEGTVASLTYLKRAGRVSAASAFFGGILNVKPIIIADAKGQNAAVEKVMGKMSAFNRIAERTAENIILSPEHDTIFIAHADCLEDAELIKNLLSEKLKNNGIKIKFDIDYVGGCVGSSTGPGTIMVEYYGKKIEYQA